MIHKLAAAIFFIVIVGSSADPIVITADQGLEGWSDQYYVQGILSLPYAEINEPFVAYYDAANGRSRIDYYGGSVQSYQRGDLGDYGMSWTVAPMTTDDQLNVKTCFEVNGTASSVVSAQSVLPDVSEFSMVGEESYGGVPCQRWQSINTVGDKINKYTLWVRSSDPTIAVHYEMLGYDSLLGSHYDKYEVDYFGYTAGPIEASVFDVHTEGLTCGSFPGPGVQYSAFNNPMKEFIHSEENHVHEMFETFKSDYNKNYKHDTEHEERKNAFRHNLRYIHSVNRAGLPYKLAVNHLADHTQTELRRMRGRLSSGNEYNGGLPFPEELESVTDLPDSIDWRIQGAVTPVKDQSVCGSCWSFGTTGTLEGSLFLKTGKLVRLSQQALIDCSWGYGNNGCDGGEDYRAYRWIMTHGGIPAEEMYGNYLGNDGYCHFSQLPLLANISGYVNVTSGDANALKIAIFKQGPISVSIDASLRSFSFYSHGVYYDADCGNTEADLDHSVLAVGYGTLDGQDYWLVKNSWSTYWGNDGYVLISQTDNNCGVTTAPTYVLM